MSLFPKRYADVVQRLRVPAGFVLLAAFGWFARPTATSMETGLPIALLGLALRAWAAGHLAKNKELACGGPFAYVRNPLYLGTLLTAGGLVVAAQQWWLAPAFAAVFMLVYLPAIEQEEQHLRAIFPDYAAYAARVQRFLPLTKWPGKPVPFSGALYLRNQEYKAFLGFLVAAAWLVWRCGV